MEAQRGSGLETRDRRVCSIRGARALGALALGLLIVAACGNSTGLEAKEPAARELDPLAFEVDTAPVTLGSVTQRIAAPGSLAARRESQIGAEVTGRIQEVLVDEGDRVDQGATLFQIDPRLYEVAHRQAAAGLDLARAERLQVQSDLERAKALGHKQVMAQQEIDRIVTTLSVARARERQAREAVARAELDLSRTRVRAPYAGSIAQRLVDEGTTALVQPQTIVLVLQETAELEGRASIPETRLSTVRVGDRARIRVEGLADPIESTISSVSNSVDPATRTYEVRMPVPNADHRLKAGIFAEFEILCAPRTGVLLVPRAALRTAEGRTRVLVVRDDRAVAVPIVVGVIQSDTVEVVSGLHEGDRVIVGDSAQTVVPGMRVEARDESPAAS